MCEDKFWCVGWESSWHVRRVRAYPLLEDLDRVYRVVPGDASGRFRDAGPEQERPALTVEQGVGSTAAGRVVIGGDFRGFEPRVRRSALAVNRIGIKVSAADR